jgi:hypothetical protein
MTDAFLLSPTTAQHSKNNHRAEEKGFAILVGQTPLHRSSPSKVLTKLTDDLWCNHEAAVAFRSTARTIAEDIVAERKERVELLSSAGEWKRVARDSAAAAAGVSGNMVSLAYMVVNC